MAYLRRTDDGITGGGVDQTPKVGPGIIDALRRSPRFDREPAAPGEYRPVADDGRVIRRRVSVRGHPNHLQDGKFGNAEDLLDAVDAATTKAFGQVVSRPLFTGLEDLVATNGYIGLWVERVREELGGAAGAATAAQFGYAIESLTTYLLGDSAAGWSLTYQVSAGPTRPDIVAKKGDAIMWLDLTAEPSARHIYTLKNWHQPKVCPYPHAEITYTPFDGGTRAVVLKSGAAELSGKPNGTVIDPVALQQQVAAARLRLAANKKRWKEKYVPLLERKTNSALQARKLDPASADVRARNAVFTWLNQVFPKAAPFDLVKLDDGGGRRRPRTHTKVARGPYDRPTARSFSRVTPETEEEAEARRQRESEQQQRETEQARLAGSILSALGVNPAVFGLWFASVSEARGIAFLQEQDPDGEAQAQ